MLVLGLTFKENVSDLRNSRVVDVIDELREYGVEVVAHDPLVDAREAGHEFGLGRWTVGPLASLQYTKLWIDGFTETGADSLNLRVASQRHLAAFGG